MFRIMFVALIRFLKLRSCLNFFVTLNPRPLSYLVLILQVCILLFRGSPQLLGFSSWNPGTSLHTCAGAAAARRGREGTRGTGRPCGAQEDFGSGWDGDRAAPGDSWAPENPAWRRRPPSVLSLHGASREPSVRGCPCPVRVRWAALAHGQVIPSFPFLSLPPSPPFLPPFLPCQALARCQHLARLAGLGR